MNFKQSEKMLDISIMDVVGKIPYIATVAFVGYVLFVVYVCKDEEE